MTAYRFWRAMCWLLTKPLFRLASQGREHIPATGPVVLVPNHVSFLDPPFTGICCPRPVRFMARSTLAHHKVFAWWMQTVGVVLIDRTAPARATFGESLRILARGEVMAVFPEGTRSPDGRLHEFKKGLLKLLDKTGAIAVPTGIIGAFEAWPRHRKLPRPLRCRVRFGPPMTAAEVCAPGGYERLRQAVASLSGQELAPIVDAPGTATPGVERPPRSLVSDVPPPRDIASAG